MSLRHYQIQVNVEYKGISLEGIADYTKKRLLWNNNDFTVQRNSNK